MDEERQIRFLIPPFFLATSLLWGAYLSPSVHLKQIFNPLEAKDIIALLGIGTVAAIPIGYFIGSLSHFVLRLLFWLFRQAPFEASLPETTLRRIWDRLDTGETLNRKRKLYASVTLDFQLIPPGVHGWITRRWSGFNIAINSAMALEISHLVGYALKIPQSSTWTLTSIILVIILTSAGCVAYRETMTMLDFQSQRTLASSSGRNNRRF